MSDLAKIMRESLEESIKDGSFQKRIEERLAKEQTQKDKIVEQYFPEHVAHKKEEDNWQYFDAMFISFDLKCECGATLTVTREMVKS
jgi:hypothetical protein